MTERPGFRAADELLDDITRHSLDEDYQVAARTRRSRPPASGRPPRLNHRLSHRLSQRSRPRLLAVLAAFGVLLSTAAVETSRGAADSERSRAALIEQVQQRRGELAAARQDAAQLQAAVSRLARTRSRLTTATDQVQVRSRQLGAATGAEQVTGPGMRIVVDDNPRAATERQVVLDTDLQRLVNGLWVAGAEAVAINGQRLTNLTAIRQAGEAITVNFRSLRRPYVVEAIGDPDELPARFVESDGGSWWFNLRSVYSLRFELSSEDSVTLPAVPSLRLREAQRADGRVTGR